MLHSSAFKACHPKVKSFYFAADGVDDMNRYNSMMQVQQNTKLAAGWQESTIMLYLSTKQYGFYLLCSNEEEASVYFGNVC